MLLLSSMKGMNTPIIMLVSVHNNWFKKVCHHSHCRNATGDFYGFLGSHVSPVGADSAWGTSCGGIAERPCKCGNQKQRRSSACGHCPSCHLDHLGSRAHAGHCRSTVKYVIGKVETCWSNPFWRTPFALHPVLALVTRRLVHLSTTLVRRV